jgi:hypothetical protein
MIVGIEHGTVGMFFLATSRHPMRQHVRSLLVLGLRSSERPPRLVFRLAVFRECAAPELSVEVGLAYRTEHLSIAVEKLITFLQQAMNENP